MNKVTKIIIAAIVAVYIISPVDALPGPIDDAVLAIGSWYFMNRKRFSKKRNDVIEDKTETNTDEGDI